MIWSPAGGEATSKGFSKGDQGAMRKMQPLIIALTGAIVRLIEATLRLIGHVTGDGFQHEGQDNRATDVEIGPQRLSCSI